MRSRRDTLGRAIKLIKLFESGRPITARDVMNKLELSTPVSARKWIDAASCHLPIYEYNTPDTPISWQNPTRYLMKKD